MYLCKITNYVTRVPISETKGSLFDLKMAFSGKGDKRSVACETIEPDEPVNNDFIRLSVMYFENRM